MKTAGVTPVQRDRAIAMVIGTGTQSEVAAIDLMHCLSNPDDDPRHVRTSTEVQGRLVGDAFLNVAALKEGVPLMALVKKGGDVAAAVTEEDNLLLFKRRPHLIGHVAVLGNLTHSGRNCAVLLLEKRGNDQVMAKLLDDTNGEEQLAGWVKEKPSRVGEFFKALSENRNRRAEELFRLGDRAYVNDAVVKSAFIGKYALPDSLREPFSRLFESAPELSHNPGFQSGTTFFRFLYNNYLQQRHGDPTMARFLNALRLVAEHQDVSQRQDVLLNLVQSMSVRENLGDLMDILSPLAGGQSTPKNAGIAHALLTSTVLEGHLKALGGLPITKKKYLSGVAAKLGELEYKNEGVMGQQLDEIFNGDAIKAGRAVESEIGVRKKKGVSLSPGLETEYVRDVMQAKNAGERECWTHLGKNLAKLSGIYGQHNKLYNHLKSLISGGEFESAKGLYNLCDGGVTPRIEFLVHQMPKAVELMIKSKSDQTAGILSACAVHRQGHFELNPHAKDIVDVVQNMDSGVQAFIQKVNVSEWTQLAEQHSDLFGQMLSCVSGSQFETAQLCIAARNRPAGELDYLAALILDERVKDSDSDVLANLRASLQPQPEVPLIDRLKKLAGEETDKEREARLAMEDKDRSAAAELAAKKAAEDAERKARERAERLAKEAKDVAAKQKAAEVAFIRDLIISEEFFPHPSAEVREKALAEYDKVSDKITPDAGAFDRMFNVMKDFIPEENRPGFFARAVSSQEFMDFFASQRAIGNVATIARELIPEDSRAGFIEEDVFDAEKRKFYTTLDENGLRRMVEISKTLPQAQRQGFVGYVTAAPEPGEMLQEDVARGFSNAVTMGRITGIANDLVSGDFRDDFIGMAVKQARALFEDDASYDRFGLIARAKADRTLPESIVSEYFVQMVSHPENFSEYTRLSRLSTGKELCSQLERARNRAGLAGEGEIDSDVLARNVFLRQPSVFNRLTEPDGLAVDRAKELFHSWDDISKINRDVASAYVKAVLRNPELVIVRQTSILNLVHGLSSLAMELSQQYTQTFSAGLFYTPEVWAEHPNIKQMGEKVKAFLSGNTKEFMAAEPQHGVPHVGEKRLGAGRRGEVRWHEKLVIPIAPGMPPVPNPIMPGQHLEFPPTEFNSAVLGRVVPVRDVFQGLDFSIIRDLEFQRIRPRLNYHEEQLLTAVVYYLSSMASRTGEGQPQTKPGVNADELNHLCMMHPLLGVRYGSRPDLFAEDLSSLRGLGAVEGRLNITLSDRFLNLSFGVRSVDAAYLNFGGSVDSSRLRKKLGEMHIDAKKKGQYQRYLIVLSNQPAAIVETERMIGECSKLDEFKGEPDLIKVLSQIRETLINNQVVCSFGGRGYGLHMDYYHPGRIPGEYASYPEVFNPLQTLKRCCAIGHYGGGEMPHKTFSGRVHSPVTLERNILRLTAGRNIPDASFTTGIPGLTETQQRVASQRTLIVMCLSNMTFCIDYGGKLEHLKKLMTGVGVEGLLTLMRDQGIVEQPSVGLYKIAGRYVKDTKAMEAVRSQKRQSSGEMDANIKADELDRDIDERMRTRKSATRDNMKKLVRLMSHENVFVEGGARLEDLQRLLRQVSRESRDLDIPINPSTIGGNVDGLTQEIESQAVMAEVRGRAERVEKELQGVPAVLRKAKVNDVPLVILNPV